MLSICIPIFNYDIKRLITALNQQAVALDCNYEIICIDDASDDVYRNMNRELCSSNIRYIQLEENIGRARIRNLFAGYASYEYLLFLDCDLVIPHDDFLKKYIDCIDETESVVCGGLVYASEKPSRTRRLRWKYGHTKESIALANRIANSYKSFMTSNFLIHREVFASVKFDERLTRYGHEDTLFGYCICQNNIPITHIQNPVLHENLETNAAFVAKTEQGLSNLVKILEYVNSDPVFIENVTVLKFYKKCLLYHLSGSISVVFFLLKPLLRFCLVKGFAPLRWFDFYKLGFLATLLRTETKRSVNKPGYHIGV